MEGNLPSMKRIESLGFKLHRTLVMPGLAIYKEIKVDHKGVIRPIASEELIPVSDLVNDTWQGYDFF
jgi:hypothetical protein